MVESTEPEFRTSITRYQFEQFIGLSVSDYQWDLILAGYRLGQATERADATDKTITIDLQDLIGPGSNAERERGMRPVGVLKKPEVGGIVVDGLHVPEHGLYAKRGGLRWGEVKPADNFPQVSVDKKLTERLDPAHEDLIREVVRDEIAKDIRHRNLAAFAQETTDIYAGFDRLRTEGVERSQARPSTDE